MLSFPPIAADPSHVPPLSPPPLGLQVMACPGGCLNGGGQPKPGPGVTPQQLIEQLERAYHHQVGAGP